MLFVPDDRVIGKWVFFGNIDSMDAFDPGVSAPFSGKGSEEIYFLPNGQKYWIFEGWTKGILLIHYGGDEPVLRCKYTVRTCGKDRFLFLEMAEETPYICVLKQVSDKAYTLAEIGRRDPIDLPFVPDDRIVGAWRSVAYVDHADDFSRQNNTENLWLKSVCFFADGRAQRVYDDMIWTDAWTKGVLLDKTKSTASAYEIRTINAVEYLFLQWKMGNYVYGGQAPGWYVFVKADD